MQLLPIDQPALFGQAACKDIFGDGQLVHQIQLLENNGDSQAVGNLGICNVHSFAIDQDLTGIFFVVAVENFHQCGFAGAVFADQGANFALGHCKAYVIQRLDAGEAFTDAAHLKKCTHRLWSPSL